MGFIQALPAWGKNGAAPTASKQAAGWLIGDHPPAEWMNWHWYTTFKALEEIQANAIHKDGTTPFTGQIKSTVANGTAPLSVVSGTVVANLNADMLDGRHADTASTANTVAARNANGYLTSARFISDVAQGTSPLAVTSTTVVANLNADMVDGEHVNEGAVAQTIAGRDNNGDLTSRRFISTVATGTAPFGVTSSTVVTNLNADTVDGFHMNQDVRTTASPTFVKATFSQATGTAPFAVTSPTLVTNLNADMLDGSHASVDGEANTVALRGATGNLAGNILVSQAAAGTAPLVVASSTIVANLNADMVDGYHLNQDLRTTASPTFAGLTAPRFTSTQATGTAPFTVASQTVVTNLNADMVDGFHASASTTPNTVVVRSGGGNIEANIINAKAAQGTAPFVVDSTTVVANLNADMVDGLHASAGSAASTLVARDANQDIFARRGTFNAANGVVPLVITSQTTVTNLNADMVDGYHFNQSLLTTSSPTFSGLTVGNASISGDGTGNMSLPAGITHGGTDSVGAGYTWKTIVGPMNSSMPTYILLAPVARGNLRINGSFFGRRGVSATQAQDEIYVNMSTDSSGASTQGFYNLSRASRHISPGIQFVTCTYAETSFYAFEINGEASANRGYDVVTFTGHASNAEMVIQTGVTDVVPSSVVSPGIVAQARSGVPEIKISSNTIDNGAGAANFVSTVTGQRFISTQTTGTAPFTVASTTVVANLNADTVDGYHFDQGLRTSDSPIFRALSISHSAPIISLVESDQAANEKKWWIVADAKMLQVRTITDADGTGTTALSINRGTGTAVSSISANVQIASNVTTGTAPFYVASTTVVSNLNADMVDGFHLNQDVRTTAAPTFRALTIDNETLTMKLPTSATGSWARGFKYADQAGTSEMGGIGIHGTAATASKIYMAHGANPWDSLKGIYVAPNGYVGIGKNTGMINALEVAGSVLADRFVSEVATGTPPMKVQSTTLVTNFNADLLDGLHGTWSPIGDTVAARDTNGDLYGRRLVSAMAQGTAPLEVNSTTVVSKLNADLLDGFHASTASGANSIVAQDANQDITVRRLISNAATGTAPLAVTSTTVVPNLNADLLDGKHASDFASSVDLNSKANLATTPQQTTTDVNYYVSISSGSDNNSGTTLAPFKTIGKAISMIPKVVNHAVTINVASGSFGEAITLSGFSGGGTIAILGATSATTTHKINAGITVERCTCRVEIKGLESTTSAARAFYVVNSNEVLFQYCRTTVNSTFEAFFIDSAKVHLANCMVSSRSGAAVYAHTNSEVLTQDCLGVTNSKAYCAWYGGKIHISGTARIQGTVSTEAKEGGIITEGDGAINPWGDNTSEKRSHVQAGATGLVQVPYNTWTKMQFPGPHMDQLGEYDRVTSTFTAKKKGVYSISVAATFDATAAATGVVHVQVYKNGSPDYLVAGGQSSLSGTQTVAGGLTMDVNAGDTIQIYIWTSIGSGIQLSSSPYYTRLNITRVA